MKKLLIVAAGIAGAGVITGSTILVNNQYNQYKNIKLSSQQETASAEAAKLAKVRNEDTKNFNKLQAAFDQLHVECEKGAAAYVQLAPATKSKTAAPNCGAVIAKI